MTEQPEHDKAQDDQQEDQEDSQQAEPSTGSSDPAPAEQGIPLPAEDSELSEGA